MKTPTTTAIETAVRNAERDAHKYEIRESGKLPGVFVVAKKAGELSDFYLVKPVAGTCSCPQFERAGVCKHQKLVEDHRALLAAEEAYENRFDCEMGKF